MKQPLFSSPEELATVVAQLKPEALARFLRQLASEFRRTYERGNKWSVMTHLFTQLENTSWAAGTASRAVRDLANV